MTSTWCWWLPPLLQMYSAYIGEREPRPFREEPETSLFSILSALTDSWTSMHCGQESSTIDDDTRRVFWRKRRRYLIWRVEWSSGCCCAEHNAMRHREELLAAASEWQTQRSAGNWARRPANRTTSSLESMMLKWLRCLRSLAPISLLRCSRTQLATRATICSILHYAFYLRFEEKYYYRISDKTGSLFIMILLNMKRFV